MKKLLLPLVLFSFAVLSLSIVHLDNISKLEIRSNELRKKQSSSIDSMDNQLVDEYFYEMNQSAVN
ncbi:hypothetical protein [Aquimarina sp. 2201CG5-10]|uniref:hypothetical protein n=1 Tax=Aquimarina callyspongiae TaxID=3098150 RepID=UPI002AB54701|nr:hypothetical protein [Aquimarina sp. 2201CG5-10]MDY8135543.1 hypothetical protein [Aquimarina sp. 2201CG5-10]